MNASEPSTSCVLFIVSAPSGAGKTSLVNALLGLDDKLAVSVSHTTRPRRPGEVEGENYHFVSAADYQHMVAAGAFLEHAAVFGNHYGTATATVLDHFARGHDVILEIDWQGAAQVRNTHPDAVSIFILPPSLLELRARLEQRGQDSAAVIQARLAEAQREMRQYGQFDYLVVNDQFDQALEHLWAIVRAERCRRGHALFRLKKLLDNLLSEV